MATIGPSGGTVRGSGSLAGVSVTFPPGALAADTLVRLEPGGPVPAVRSLPVGRTFHVDARGAQLAVPATVTIPYDQAALYSSFEGADESQLWILKQEDATGAISWNVPTTTDTQNQLVSMEVTSFSTFGGATAAPARYVYVSNFGDGTPQNIGDDTISIYSVNNGTGRLRCVGYVYVGNNTQPTPVSVDPFGLFVFAANFAANDAVGYGIQSNGFLTPFTFSGTSTTIGTGSGPVSIGITPQLTAGYSANFNANPIGAYGPFGTQGQVTLVATYNTSAATGGGGTDPEWIAMAPGTVNGNDFLYVPCFASNNVLSYEANRTTGALTSLQTISAVAANSNPIGAVVDPSSHYLYVADWTSGVIEAYGINQTSGLLSRIDATSASASVVNPIALTTDIYGDYVVTCNFGSNNLTSFAINGTTGALATSPASNVPAGSGPNAIQRDPAGNYVYMVNQSSNSASAYSLSKTNGALALASTVRTQTLPTAISVSAGTGQNGAPSTGVSYTSNYLYAPTANNSSVSAYNVSQGANPPKGELSQNATHSYSIGTGSTQPLTVATDPQFKYVYFARGDGNVYAYSINLANGQLTSIGTTNVTTTGTLSSIVCEPSDRFAYVLERTTTASATSPGAIAVMNIGANGALTLAATVAHVGTASAQQLTVDPTGRFLYVADDGTNTSPARQESVICYGINAGTGGLTLMNQTFTGGHSVALANEPFPLSAAVDSTGQYLYIPNMAENSISEYAIDATAGTLTSIGSITPTLLPGLLDLLSAPASIVANPAMDALYVVSTGTLNLGANAVASFSINPATGALTFLSSVAADNGPFAISVDIAGAYAYVSNAASGKISMYSVGANGSLAANGGTSAQAPGGTPFQFAIVGTVQ
jgi:6-phosphogluconolactonase (cycloisomerase 2 family)